MQLAACSTVDEDSARVFADVVVAEVVVVDTSATRAAVYETSTIAEYADYILNVSRATEGDDASVDITLEVVSAPAPPGMV